MSGRAAIRVGVISGMSWVAGVILALNGPGAAAGPQARQAVKIASRLEVEGKADSFTVRFFLKNEGAEAIKVVYGHGRRGQEVVPTFHVFQADRDEVSIRPPIYLVPGFRHMNPDTLLIPAHKEVLYGSYTMGYPRRNFDGRTPWMIRADFAELERQLGSQNSVVSKPIPFPERPGH